MSKTSEVVELDVLIKPVDGKPKTNTHNKDLEHRLLRKKDLTSTNRVLKTFFYKESTVFSHTLSCSEVCAAKKMHNKGKHDTS